MTEKVLVTAGKIQQKIYWKPLNRSALYRCSLCCAVVVDGYFKEHADWHARLVVLQGDTDD